MSEQVRKWVTERRAAQGDGLAPADGSEIWGLALSGGGIRSAIFCFGLVRSLAKYGGLPRFDVISTVSGGGYIGGALGKLFHHAQDNQEVRKVYAALQQDDHNWLTWWLRANGRYLIPRGFKDSVFALALYFQNLLAVHIEFGVLAVLLAMALALFNIAVWTGMTAFPQAQDFLAAMPYGFHWLPTLWLLLIPLGLIAFVLMASYWTLPEPSSEGSRKPIAYIPLAAAVLLALSFVRPPLGGFDRMAMSWLASVFTTLGLALAVPVARYALSTARFRFQKCMQNSSEIAACSESLVCEEARHLLINMLGRLGRLATVLLVTGVLDRLAWFLAFEVELLSWLMGGFVVFTALLRALLPKLVPSSTTVNPVLAVSLTALGNVVGYLMLLCVVLLWLTSFDKLLFVESASLVDFSRTAFGVTLVLMGGLFAYAWITRLDFGFLNLSSLHNFYRARITRSFLGAANGLRFPRQPGGPSLEMLHALDAVPDEPPGGRVLVEVTSVHECDDVAMASYQPQRQGGPVHLINICLNETSDRRGGLFNQDRRGLPMVVGPGAIVRVGSQPWQQAQGNGVLTLGRWTAISGAAFAPGLGQMTRGGVSAISTLAGLRLGYWWPSQCLDGPTVPVPQGCSKSSGLLNELLGNFQAGPGLPWYLSDGGHYENTAALTLLAEKASLIVLADCGADPRYGFSDLENLVRKSRIDLQAEIEFLRPCVNQVDSSLDSFGSLDDLASPDSVACLSLARIRYACEDNPGYLVLVKPNLSLGMTADLVNFKRDHPDFPQETTTDQFFGEAQWESYFKLGLILGHSLSADFLFKISSIASTRFEDDRGPVAKHLSRTPTDVKPEDATNAPVRFPSRIAGSALAASVGLGAVATLGVTAWQTIDGFHVSYAANRQAEQSALKELSERYGNWTLNKPETLGPLAGALLHAADQTCNSGSNEWFRTSLLAQCILQDVYQACAKPASEQMPACHMLLVSDAAVCLKAQVGRRTALYWNHAFDDPARPKTESCQIIPAMVSVPTAAEVPGGNVESAGVSGLNTMPDRAKPTPIPAPAILVPPSLAPTGVPFAMTNVCAGKIVYVQIFGGAQRDALRSLLSEWRLLGVSVPPVEDVLDSARRAGRSAPRADGSKTRTYFHDGDSEACAKLLVEKSEGKYGLPRWEPSKKLPPRLRATPGTIEVWVAPPPPSPPVVANE